MLSREEARDKNEKREPENDKNTLLGYYLVNYNYQARFGCRIPYYVLTATVKFPLVIN